jgi:hypothetical protein
MMPENPAIFRVKREHAEEIWEPQVFFKHLYWSSVLEVDNRALRQIVVSA